MNATTESHPSTTRSFTRWIAPAKKTLCYAIALGLYFGGPGLIAASLVVAVVLADASVIGLGLIAGAVMGGCGALALLWCLKSPQTGAARPRT